MRWGLEPTWKQFRALRRPHSQRSSAAAWGSACRRPLPPSCRCWPAADARPTPPTQSFRRSGASPTTSTASTVPTLDSTCVLTCREKQSFHDKDFQKLIYFTTYILLWVGANSPGRQSWITKSFITKLNLKTSFVLEQKLRHLLALLWRSTSIRRAHKAKANNQSSSTNPRRCCNSSEQRKARQFY